MLKQFIVISLLTSIGTLTLAQEVGVPQSQAATAPQPQAAASAPKKHKYFHAPKLRRGATAAVDPETSPDKKGGQ